MRVLTASLLLVPFLSCTGLSTLPYFPPGMLWQKDRSQDPPHPESSAVISYLSVPGNSWYRDELRIDLSFTVFEVNATDTPHRIFEKRPGEFYDGECDYGGMPVPRFGAIEGEEGYHCSGDGDCHLIGVDRENKMLYEMWRHDTPGGGAGDSPTRGGCTSFWNLSNSYGWNADYGYDYNRPGRGLDCTSADAAGFPIAPLLFTPEELDAGEIRHALRFTLPNDKLRARKYVFPATHATYTSGPRDAPPYGFHLRLKPTADLEAAHPSVDFNALSKGAKVIIAALQKYGMLHADGGRIPLMGVSDRFSEVKYWDRERYRYGDDDPDRLLHEHDLKFLRAGDFELLDNGGVERRWGDEGCTLLAPYSEAFVSACAAPVSVPLTVPGVSLAYEMGAIAPSQVPAVQFTLSYPAAGYGALGLRASSGNSGSPMAGLDVYAVHPDGAQVSDHLISSGPGKPVPDVSQDAVLVSQSTTGGVTTAVFWRRLDTGDEGGDFRLYQGSAITLAVAIGPGSVLGGSWDVHSYKETIDVSMQCADATGGPDTIASHTVEATVAPQSPAPRTTEPPTTSVPSTTAPSTPSTTAPPTRPPATTAPPPSSAPVTSAPSALASLAPTTLEPANPQTHTPVSSTLATSMPTPSTPAHSTPAPSPSSTAAPANAMPFLKPLPQTAVPRSLMSVTKGPLAASVPLHSTKEPSQHISTRTGTPAIASPAPSTASPGDGTVPPRSSGGIKLWVVVVLLCGTLLLAVPAAVCFVLRPKGDIPFQQFSDTCMSEGILHSEPPSVTSV